jgi:hypothetical protein
MAKKIRAVRFDVWPLQSLEKLFYFGARPKRDLLGQARNLEKRQSQYIWKTKGNTIYFSDKETKGNTIYWAV